MTTAPDLFHHQHETTPVPPRPPSASATGKAIRPISQELVSSALRDQPSAVWMIFQRSSERVVASVNLASESFERVLLRRRLKSCVFSVTVYAGRKHHLRDVILR